MQRRVGLQNDAWRTPWRLLSEIAQADPGRRAIGLPVGQRIADLLMPGHRPYLVLLKPQHRACLAQAFMVRIGIAQERVRKRINGGDRTVNCRIHACHTCSRFLMLRCGYPFVRILQPSPGIVTSSLLLFKCPGDLLDTGAFQMPTPAHSTASLSDDPALLRIEGPIATITLNRPSAFNTTLRRMPKIVLASVHGSAAGAGLSLAFVADLCIAAEDARFTPAYAKLGVSPDGGGTVGLAASVGPRRALQIFLAEDSFSAAQAYDWGLVATKALIHRAHVTPIEQQLDAERDAIIDCMHTDEFRVAVKKFTSKGK